MMLQKRAPAPPAIPAANTSPIAAIPIPPDATEEPFIGLWLHGKSPNTIRAYGRDIAAFRAFIGKPILLAYLDDLQRYTDALEGSSASRARRLLVVKSLLPFAARMGFTAFNVGAGIRAPRPDDRLAERIVDETRVFALLDAVEENLRDRALLRVLYNGGLRVSEAVTLQWRNLVDRIVNVRGRGGRTRVVRLSRETWAERQALRPAAAQGDDRVFPDHGLERVGPSAPRGTRGRPRGAGLTALPAAFPRDACPAPRRRSRNLTRDAGPHVLDDHGAVPSCTAREIQPRLSGPLTRLSDPEEEASLYAAC